MKTFIYVLTLLPLGVLPNITIKTFLTEEFFPFAAMSCEYLLKCSEKFETALLGWSGALGETDS